MPDDAVPMNAVADPQRIGDGGPPRPRGRAWRGLWVAVHRYVGLTIATFLVVAGLTGSVLAFYEDLDVLINPRLMRADPPTPDARPLDPLVLRERLAEQFPERPPKQVILKHEPGRSIVVWQRAPDGGWLAYFIDPYTGAALGSRSGHLGDGVRENLMPFIYRLHEELALGTVGFWILGVVALLWTIDCFVGLYLTFPLRRSAASAADDRGWLARWKPSWLVRASSLFGAVFTFHRASGLWLWPLLLVFAWSSVGFNLRPVYYPIMGLLGRGPDVWSGLPRLERPRPDPALGWPAALERARALMAEEGARRGFAVMAEGWLEYQDARGFYQYRVHSTHDIGDRYPGTRIWFDGDSGALLGYWAPSGIAAGETTSGWLVALHMGTVGGTAYRILLVAVGIVTAALSITGAVIWWRKRQGRARAAATRGGSAA